MHTHTYMYFFIYTHTHRHTRTLARDKKQRRAAYNNSKQQLMLVILDLAARTHLCAFHIEIHAWSKDRQLPAQCLAQPAPVLHQALLPADMPSFLPQGDPIFSYPG